MRNRAFFSLVMIVLAISYTYSSWSLGRSYESPIWVWILNAIPFLGIVVYPLLFFASRNRAQATPPPKRPGTLQWLAYFSMAGLSFLMPLVILRDVLVLATFKWAGNFAGAIMTPLASSLILATAVLMLILGVYTGTAGPRIKKVNVSLENANADKSEALRGLKLAQISDLHVGPTIDQSYVQKVVDRTNSLSPDFIFLTGDIADGRLDVYENDIAPLRDLRAKHGVFFVMGNHEFYWDGPKWLEHMRKLGMQTLSNENRLIRIQGSLISIAGVLDPAAAMVQVTDGPKVQTAMAGTDQADFKILLAHQPGIYDQALASGVDLQLSGHTHGGQFFPWNFVVRKVHKYYQGLSRLGRMQIYVSPGTGSWGPPVRLGTRPEITQLTLVGR